MILQPREKTNEALVFVLTTFGGWIKSQSDLELPAQGQDYVSDIHDIHITDPEHEVWKWSPFANTSIFICRKLYVIHSFVAIILLWHKNKARYVKQKARYQNRPPMVHEP